MGEERSDEASKPSYYRCGVASEVIAMSNRAPKAARKD